MKHQLAGKKFDALLILNEAERVRSACGSIIRYWDCLCDCGKVKRIAQISLVKKITKSCGCLKKSNRWHITHGKTGIPEYAAWSGMIQRCSNPKNNRYSRYGGRGISYCERWSKFENFLEDMGPKPSPTHSIDRINNNGNYEPGNCRWATASEQSLNTSRNKRVLMNGKIMTYAEVGKALGVCSGTVRYRHLKELPLDKKLHSKKASK